MPLNLALAIRPLHAQELAETVMHSPLPSVKRDNRPIKEEKFDK
jgi:hypothetical protein